MTPEFGPCNLVGLWTMPLGVARGVGCQGSCKDRAATGSDQVRHGGGVTPNTQGKYVIRGLRNSHGHARDLSAGKAGVSKLGSELSQGVESETKSSSRAITWYVRRDYTLKSATGSSGDGCGYGGMKARTSLGLILGGLIYFEFNGPPEHP